MSPLESDDGVNTIYINDMGHDDVDDDCKYSKHSKQCHSRSESPKYRKSHRQAHYYIDHNKKHKPRNHRNCIFKLIIANFVLLLILTGSVFLYLLYFHINDCDFEYYHHHNDTEHNNSISINTDIKTPEHLELLDTVDDIHKILSEMNLIPNIINPISNKMDNVTNQVIDILKQLLHQLKQLQFDSNDTKPPSQSSTTTTVKPDDDNNQSANILNILYNRTTKSNLSDLADELINYVNYNKHNTTPKPPPLPPKINIDTFNNNDYDE